MAPLISSKLSASRTWMICRFWAVRRTWPMWPGIFMPRMTVPGKRRWPMAPERRRQPLAPCEASPPRKLCRFITPSKPRPLVTPMASTKSPWAKMAAPMTSPGLTGREKSRNSRTRLVGSGAVLFEMAEQAAWSRDALFGRRNPVGRRCSRRSATVLVWMTRLGPARTTVTGTRTP